MNKVVLALAIMAATGAIFLSTFQLAQAALSDPITPPGLLRNFPFWKTIPPNPVTPPGLLHPTNPPLDEPTPIGPGPHVQPP